MTVESAASKFTYNGDGIVTAFTTPQFTVNTDITAVLRDALGVETTWIESTDYTLTGAGDPNGTLTATTAPATGETLVVFRDPPIVQGSDYPVGGPFPSTTVEQGFDLLTFVAQRLDEQFDRAITFPETDTGTNSDLPSTLARANKFFAFDGVGGLTVAAGTSADLTPVSTFINDNLLAAATAAVARTALGAADDTLVAKLAGNNALTGDNTVTGELNVDGPLALGDGSELTIATGSITPTGNYHTVDTEADAASDPLTDIATTNIPDGGLLVLRAVDATHTVVVTHTASGAGKIVLDGDADYTIDDDEKSITLQRRGDHWEEIARSNPKSPISIGTEQATTSGTEIDFTDIKADAQRITIMLDQVSTNGTSNLVVRLGDAGGFEATGYTGSVSLVGGTVATSVQTTGLGITQALAATSITSGLVTLVHMGGNSWAGTAQTGRSAVAIMNLGATAKTLTDTLTQIRITADGVDTFDAGTINVLVE